MKAAGSDVEGDDERESFSWGMGNKVDSAFGGSLAVGYDFNPRCGLPLRAEIEYAVFSEIHGKKSSSGYDADDDFYKVKAKQTFNIQTLFLNAYYDINTGTAFTPYLGAGVGLGFINTKYKMDGYIFEGNTIVAPANDRSSRKDVTNFIWNVGAGVDYALDDNWSVDLGYRFVGLGSVKTKSCSQAFEDYSYTEHMKTKNLYMHQIALGLRYSF